MTLVSVLAQEWENIHENGYTHVQITRAASASIEAMRRVAGLGTTTYWPLTERKLESRLACLKFAKPKHTPDIVGTTWDAAYPDRTPWSKLSKDTQDEWRRVFGIYETILLR